MARSKSKASKSGTNDEKAVTKSKNKSKTPQNKDVTEKDPNDTTKELKTVKSGKKGTKKVGGKGGKEKKKGKRKKKKKPRCPVKRRKKPLKRKCTDMLGPDAVFNSYYTCHGVPDMLLFRKFKWKEKKK